MSISTIPVSNDSIRWLLYKILLRLNALPAMGGSDAGQAGIQAISNGASSVAVVFGTAFSVKPSVVGNLSRNAGGNLFGYAIDADSVTVNGFTVHLDSSADDATFEFHWIARIPTQ